MTIVIKRQQRTNFNKDAACVIEFEVNLEDFSSLTEVLKPKNDND